jgi:hypothetical protein
LVIAGRFHESHGACSSGSRRRKVATAAVVDDAVGGPLPSDGERGWLAFVGYLR